MALLRKLEYHEDTTEKRQITKEDIEFLKNLQKEMNTQDTVGQADPRFWVIKGTRREYGIECGYEDGYEITSDDNSYDIDEFIKLVEENGYINEIMEQEDEKYIIQKDEFECIEIYDHNEDLIDEFELYDFISYLNDNVGTDFHLTGYRDMPYIYPDTFFLTNKAAQEALKTCSHHFSKDAHTYAMTALYSPEVEKLWDILRRVDFSILEHRPKGKWIEVDIHNCYATLKCSVCDRIIKPTFTFGEYSYEDIKMCYPFCTCGADMRGEEE